MNRRDFLKAAALGAAGVLGRPRIAAAADEQERTSPLLRLGVLSDIHIFDEKQVPVFERALEFFRDRKADGVIIAGDMADRGLVSQLELAANAWFKVFPENRRPDGQPIEKLFIYGNHDFFMHEPNTPPEKFVATDRKAVWERLFKEPWTGIYAKQVKGYTFIGAHWGHEKELADFLKENESRLGLKGGKPFFYAQHLHPGGTVQ